jgi:hypothetical protein
MRRGAVSGGDEPNAMHLSWSAEEVDEKLHGILRSIHDSCVQGRQEDGTSLVKGANIAGFPQGGRRPGPIGLLGPIPKTLFHFFSRLERGLRTVFLCSVRTVCEWRDFFACKELAGGATAPWK